MMYTVSGRQRHEWRLTATDAKPIRIVICRIICPVVTILCHFHQVVFVAYYSILVVVIPLL